MSAWQILVLWGVPAAITTAVVGLIVWFFKRYMDKKDVEAKQREEENKKRQENIEKFMLYILRDARANNVLAVATARAVQRIPDAHCNGDMTKALERAAEIQTEEKDFIFNQGIDHIFGK